MQKLNSLIKTHPVHSLEVLTGLTFSPFQRAVIESKSPRVCVLSPRQSGKTESLVCLSLLAILQGKKVASFQPSVRQSIGLVDRVRNYLFKLGIVPVVCTRSELVLDNGGSIAGKPIRSSSRGDTIDLVIFDEIAFIEENTDDDLLAIALPFLSKVGSRLIVSSTPRGRSGLFYSLWTQANDFEKILGSVQEVRHYAPGFLSSQLDMLGTALYNREYLTKFDELNELCLFTDTDLEKLFGEPCTTLNMDTKGDSLPDGLGLTLQRAAVKTSLHFV